MDFVIPKTKEEACEILINRKFYDQPMLKYDMFLLGLVYCNDKEFNYRTKAFKNNFIYGTPCLCEYYLKDIYKCNAGNKSCPVAAQETFAMKWDDKLGD